MNERLMSFDGKWDCVGESVIVVVGASALRRLEGAFIFW